MFKKIISRLREQKQNLTLALAILAVAYSVILHYRVHKQDIDTKITSVIEAQAINQSYYEGYQRILFKVQNFQQLQIINESVGLKVLDFYERAMLSAQNRNEEYLILEYLGDTTAESYKEGMRDGKKAFLGGL